MNQHPNPTSTSNAPIFRNIKAQKSPLLLKFRVKENCPLDEFLTHRGLKKDIYTLEELLKVLSGCFTYKRGDDNSIPRLCPPDLIPVFGRPTVLIPDLLKLLGNQIECLGSPPQNCNPSENTNLGEALVNSNRIELKSNDMFSSFIFIPNSELHIYLQRTTRITKHEYTLHEILAVLKERITSNCMYDATNPTVIICDPNLAKALGCRALYISNLCRKVLQQLIRNGRQPGICGNIDFHYISENIKIKPWDGLLIPETHLLNINNEFSLVLENLKNPNAKFEISSSLREVLMMAPNTEQFLRDPQIYTIKEVFMMFSKYFTWKKSLFCVAGICDIFLFGQDPIGKVLGINSMHNSQLRFFAAKHLSLSQQMSIKLNSDITLNSEITNNKDEKVTEEGKENEISNRKEENNITDVSCREISCETDGHSEGMVPTLRKSASMPARSSNLSIVDILESGTRKRQASGGVQVCSKRNRFDEKDPAVLLASLSDPREAHQTQALVKTNNDLPDIKETEENVSNKESNEVESEKVEGKESGERNNEESCSASDHENMSSGESEVENDYSEEEYEVDSEEENKKKIRPPHAGGGGTDSDSSCENSDIDITVVRPVVAIPQDESNLADFSEDDFDKDVSMVKTKMPYHCYRCNSLQMPGVWYCIPCWRQRSDWLPPRPKPSKKRKLKNENIPNSQVKQYIQTINLNQAQNDKILIPKENKDNARDSSTTSNGDLRMDCNKPSSSTNINSTYDKIRRSNTPDTDIDSADSSNEEPDYIVKGDSGFCSTNSKENLFSSEKSSRKVYMRKKIPYTIEATETDGGNEPTKIATRNSLAKNSDSSEMEGSHGSKTKTIQGIMEDGKSSSDNLCMFCCTNKKDTSLIHGKIGHQICCYPCGKRVWREQGRCPVCNRNVEKIVRIFQD